MSDLEEEATPLPVKRASRVPQPPKSMADLDHMPRQNDDDIDFSQFPTQISRGGMPILPVVKPAAPPIRLDELDEDGMPIRAQIDPALEGTMYIPSPTAGGRAEIDPSIEGTMYIPSTGASTQRAQIDPALEGTMYIPSPTAGDDAPIRANIDPHLEGTIYIPSPRTTPALGEDDTHAPGTLRPADDTQFLAASAVTDPAIDPPTRITRDPSDTETGDSRMDPRAFLAGLLARETQDLSHMKTDYFNVNDLSSSPTQIMPAEFLARLLDEDVKPPTDVTREHIDQPQMPLRVDERSAEELSATQLPPEPERRSTIINVMSELSAEDLRTPSQFPRRQKPTGKS